MRFVNTNSASHLESRSIGQLKKQFTNRFGQVAVPNSTACKIAPSQEGARPDALQRHAKRDTQPLVYCMLMARVRATRCVQLDWLGASEFPRLPKYTRHGRGNGRNGSIIHQPTRHSTRRTALDETHTAPHIPSFNALPSLWGIHSPVPRTLESFPDAYLMSGDGEKVRTFTRKWLFCVSPQPWPNESSQKFFGCHPWHENLNNDMMG